MFIVAGRTTHLTQSWRTSERLSALLDVPKIVDIP